MAQVAASAEPNLWRFPMHLALLSISLAAMPPVLPAAPQPNAYALVVGVDAYRDAPAARGAAADAQAVAEMLRRTLGIPESNVLIALNERAAKTDVEKHLRWLRTNVRPGSRLFFFFAGHGAPDPTSGTPYLVPFDGDPKYLEETALTMPGVLAALEQTKAKEIVAIVDACFSGSGGRSVLPPGTRPLVPVSLVAPAARVLLFSASGPAETSGESPEGGGLFTRHLLEGLGGGKADFDGDGQVTAGELHEYVKGRVSRDARRENREQTPTIVAGSPGQTSLALAWGYATPEPAVSEDLPMREKTVEPSLPRLQADSETTGAGQTVTVFAREPGDELEVEVETNGRVIRCDHVATYTRPCVVTAGPGRAVIRISGSDSREAAVDIPAGKSHTVITGHNTRAKVAVIAGGVVLMGAGLATFAVAASSGLDNPGLGGVIVLAILGGVAVNVAGTSMEGPGLALLADGTASRREPAVEMAIGVLAVQHGAGLALAGKF